MFLSKWTENCNIAFAKIEEFFTGPGIMAFRMSNEGFILKKTDASCYNAGAVLVKYKMAKKELFYVPVWPWTRPRIVIIASLTENYQQ